MMLTTTVQSIMIKGAILDIDGVIVGETLGFNFPEPHTKVIEMFKNISAKKLPISLCTAKALFATKDLIIKSNLDALHISDGGAVIFNPIKNEFHTHLLNRADVKNISNLLIRNNIYVELYDLDNYYIVANQKSYITDKHTPILGKPPSILNDFTNIFEQGNILKVMALTENKEQENKVLEISKKFKDATDLNWGRHPAAGPIEIGFFTSKSITKRTGALEISKYSDIDLADMLGVGDSTSDWKFMELCGYVAAMGNASKELKDLVNERKENGFIGPSVEENGIIEIFEHFNLY